MDKNDIRQKRKARRLALQALYQWHMTKVDSHEIEVQFRLNNDFDKVDNDYFSKLLHGISQECADIDKIIVVLLVFAASFHLGVY